MKDDNNILEQFEKLDPIDPSQDWTKSLMNKLDSVKPYPPTVLSFNKFTVMALLIVLLNIGFLVNVLLHKQEQNQNRRSTELQLVSKELLINQHLFK